MTIYELAEQHRSALLAGDRAAAVRMAEAYADAFKSIKRGLVNVARDVRKRTEAKEALPAGASERKLRRAADALDRALRTDARYTGMMQQVEQQLQALGFNAAASIADQQRQAAQLSIQFAEEGAAVASGAAGAATTGAQAASNAAGVGLKWNRVPSEAVESLVGFMGDGSPLQDVFRSMAGEAADGVRQALLTGIVKGFNPEKIGMLIAKSTGASLERSILVARTETLRAYRVAAIDNYAANDDVVKAWRWHAHLGPRTCAACIAMHGKVYPLSVEFGSHPNCRCAPVPVTRSWEDLGFGSGLPEVQPGPTGEQWLEKQSADTQRQVLGAKYPAYASGEIELRDVVGYRNDRRYGPTRWEKSAKALGITSPPRSIRTPRTRIAKPASPAANRLNVAAPRATPSSRFAVPTRRTPPPLPTTPADVRAPQAVLDRVRALQDDYVIHLNGSGARTVRSVAVQELGARGYARATATALDTQAVRFMHQDTQRVLADRGITKVRLWRGLRPGGSVVEGHPTESWTSDIRIAKRFAGRGGQVLERDVPASDILMWHEHPMWRDGKYGAQSEYIVIRRPE